MPAPQRNDIAQKRRRDRDAISPYNRIKRNERMMASRSWGPSIWNALTFWRRNKEPEEEMDVEVEEIEEVPDTDQSGDLSATADESVSMMNTSAASEDQVMVQLLSRSPRQVRFQLPTDHEHRPSPQVEPTTPQKRHLPYVAPLPPSSQHPSASPYNDPIAKVSQYLETVVRPRGGECTDVEALGLSMLLQSSVNQSTSASTPNKQIPSSPFSFPAFNTPSPLRPTFTTPETNLAALLAPKLGSTTTSPTRTLARDPNGAMYFQGGGSARSRYRSPAFGSSSPRKKISFSRNFGEMKDAPNGNAEPASPSDGKRRRIGEEKDSSVAQPSGLPSAPAASKSTQEPIERLDTINKTSVSHSTLPSTLRFGATRLTASTPVRPSPLRQSVRADSSSPGSLNSSVNGVNGMTPNGSKVASDILAQIIEGATPPKSNEPTHEDDVRNPYQVGKTTKRARKTTTKVVRPPLPPPRQTRQTETTPIASEPPKKLSAFETIQRTAPQPPSQTTSKRTSGMIATTNGSTQHNGSGSSDNPVVIEPDGDDEPPTKRQKATNGTEEGISKQTQLTIDVDVDMDASNASATRPSEIIEPTDQEAQKRQEVKRTLFPSTLGKGRRFKSVPKEPSPLRQSFQPDGPPSPPTDVEERSDRPSKVSENGSSVFGSGQVSFGSETSAFKPVNLFGSTATTAVTSVFGSTTTKEAAALFQPTAIMQATLGSSSGLFGSSTSTAASFGTTSMTFATSSSSLSGIPAKTPSFGATSSTPGLGAPSTKPLSDVSPDASETPTFKAPPTSSLAQVFDTSSTTFNFPPVPLPSSVPPYTSFSTSLPSATSSVNTVDVLAQTKAEVLRLPESSLPKFEFSIPSPTQSTLHNAAERIASQNVAESDLPRFNFQVDKSPFSSEVKPPSKLAKSTSAPAPTGFNWAASGMTPPSSSGWRCEECFVENKDTSVKCVSCESENPSARSHSVEVSKVIPPATSGFNWAASGFKPSSTSGWRCGICFVENKDTSIKCLSCDSKKP